MRFIDLLNEDKEVITRGSEKRTTWDDLVQL